MEFWENVGKDVSVCQQFPFIISSSSSSFSFHFSSRFFFVLRFLVLFDSFFLFIFFRVSWITTVERIVKLVLFFFTIPLLLIIFLSFIYTFGLPMPSSECVFVQWSLHFFSPFLLSLSLSHDLLLYFYFFHFFNLFSFACVYCIVFFSSSDSLLAIQPIKVSKMTLCTPKNKKKEKSKQNRNHIIVLHFQSFDTHLYMMKSRIHISSRCKCIRDCFFTLFVIAYTFLYNVCFALCPSKHFSLNILASLYNSKQASSLTNTLANVNKRMKNRAHILALVLFRS